MILWLVGRDGKDGEQQWEFQGLYSARVDAEVRCEDETWFIAPVTVDAFVPTDTIHWPGAIRPVSGTRKKS